MARSTALMQVRGSLGILGLILISACSSPPSRPLDRAAGSTGTGNIDVSSDKSGDAASSGQDGESNSGSKSSEGSSTGQETGTSHSARSLLFVSGGSERVDVYSFDKSNGSVKLLKSNETAGARLTFLDVHPGTKKVFGVNESQSQIIMYSLDTATGSLSRQSVLPTADGPAHVSVNAKGTAAFVADYGAGAVESFSIEGDQLVAKSKVTPGKNAHAAQIDPSGKELFVPCLGSGLIARYAIGEGGLLTEASPPSIDVGSKGPRHVAFHPTSGFAYLMNEYEGSVQALRLGSSGPSLLGDRVSSTTTPVAGNTGAEIAVSPDGKFLYSSNRGDDTIAVYSIASNGQVTLLKTVKSGGQTPRHFALDPSGRWLTVANSKSGDVALFSVATGSGDLSSTAAAIRFDDPQFARVYDFDK